MQPHDLSRVHSIREALLWASSFLRAAHSRDPQFEAELLLRHVLKLDRTRFLASLPDPISAEDVERLRALCERRAGREPLQYLTGVQAFYGREFHVAPGVLIPRPETEILVEQVLHHADRLWPDGPSLEVADIGTGSGAIAVTLACERPHWRITTVDLSEEALRIARSNAERLGAAERVRFVQGDLTKPLLTEGVRLDVLVSNPPYIPSADVEQLDAEVRDYEPRLALDGGVDGLAFYRELCRSLPALLKPVALVAFEVGIRQADEVAGMLRSSGVLDEVWVVPDLAGIDRVVAGCRKI